MRVILCVLMLLMVPSWDDSHTPFSQILAT